LDHTGTEVEPLRSRPKHAVVRLHRCHFWRRIDPHRERPRMSHYLIGFVDRKQVKSDVWVVLLTVERDGELCGEAEVALSREGLADFYGDDDPPDGWWAGLVMAAATQLQGRYEAGHIATWAENGRPVPLRVGYGHAHRLANSRPPLTLLPEGSVIREFELAEAPSG